MRRTWTIIGVGDVPGSCKWYQSLLGLPETAPAARRPSPYPLPTPPSHPHREREKETKYSLLVSLLSR